MNLDLPIDVINTVMSALQLNQAAAANALNIIQNQLQPSPPEPQPQPSLPELVIEDMPGMGG